MSAAQSFDINLALSSASPAPVSGTLKLSFAPNVAIPADDPFVQFSTGTRTVAFSIPENSAAAAFPGRVSVMTGTTAGVIRLEADVDNGPSGVLLASTIVRSGPPQITRLVAERGGGVLQVQVNGYSPSRSVTGIQFAFEVRLAGTVQRIVLERSVEDEFTAWYQTAEAARFGTAFFFEQVFVVEGDQALIEAVSVTLSNNQGNSASIGGRFEN
jgi:hypothetical protein